MAFDFHAKRGGENFIFIEKGFQKLSLRQLGLRFGKRDGGNHNLIVCAGTCDYAPYIESYGQYFIPKAKVAMEQTYLQSNEYILRKQMLEESYCRMREVVK